MTELPKSESTELLKINGIKKSFGSVIALKNGQFTLKKGSIHALCGGNGAGKSTFLSILMGFLKQDSGEIIVKGKRHQFNGPKDAIEAGITIVQQELSGIPDLTVAENIWLGREPRKFGFIDFETLNEETILLLEDLKFDISYKEKMRKLSVAEQQLVEIAKALSHSNADIIIMDEPTSAIGEEDAQKIFNAINRLAEKGKGIIYVSHRLSEIFQIADTYTIFRDGEFISEGEMESINREKLIELIIGREIKDEFAKYNIPTNETIMTVKNLSWKTKVKNIEFSLNKGEILGIYGLVGSGRTELLDLIFGIQHFTDGEIILNNKHLHHHSPEESIKSGIAYVTEDRKETGLMLGRSINENINIASFSSISRSGFINDKLEIERTNKMIQLFNVKTPDAHQLVGNLSGGNQQKVVLGRWALIEPDVMLLDEPTRGVDVGAKKEIYKFMSDFALQGKGIVMVSSELSEIIGMSDRIIVFRDGQISGELLAKEATQTELMKLAV